MSPRADGTLEDPDWELLYLWSTFCHDWSAASFMSPTAELADGFANWLIKNPVTDETRKSSAAWRTKQDLGLFSFERDLLDSWTWFSTAEGSENLIDVSPNAVQRFADWLANQEPESRIRVEEMDLSMRAFNLLRSRDVRFIDQIDLDLLDDLHGRRVRAEIAEKLRRWRGDSGDTGAPVLR
jgi:hypothetical protein